MQIIYGIGIYLIASSFIMVSFVWLMNFRIKQTAYKQPAYKEISEENNYFSEQPQITQKTLAA